MKWPLGLLVVFLEVVSTTSAQSISNVDQGTQIFRVILHRIGLQPITTVDDALNDPSSTLIVLHGRVGRMQRQLDARKLRRFVANGGALMIADDQQNTHYIGDEFGVYVSGMRLSCTKRNADNAYRGSLLECPLLQPLPQSAGWKRVNLLKDLKQVATNKPSTLRGFQNDGRTDVQRHAIAYSPFGCEGHSPEERYPQLDQPQRLAEAHEIGDGRFFIIADHSVFINSMLLQIDNDNIPFTTNVINWLTENGKRNRVLFVDEGQIRDEFNINLDYLDPPLPHPDVLVPLVDKLIVGLEQDDFFNQTLLRAVPLHRILRGMLLGLTVLLTAVVLYRVTAGKWRKEPQATRLPDQVDSLADPNPNDRHALQPTPFEFGAAAQELAYSTFHDLLGDDIEAPPVVYSAGPVARRTWTRRIQVLWRIAAGQTGRTMTPANLKSLARRLIEMRRAVERGDIRLSPPEETA